MTGRAGESRGPIRIAIDAMGGENAPGVEVEGGLEAVRESGGAVEVVLVGREDLVAAELAGHDHDGLPVSVVNADEIIEMTDSPASAVRRKRGASIVVATELHKRREVDGLVGAGNTGAVVASTLLGLGMLPNVRRPAIASLFPTLKETAIVVDVGASIDSRPSDLLEFAAMGDVLSSCLFDRERPRVALMNIGEEPTKGSQLTRPTTAVAPSSRDTLESIKSLNTPPAQDRRRFKALPLRCKPKFRDGRKALATEERSSIGRLIRVMIRSMDIGSFCLPILNFTPSPTGISRR